ncbi:MAG: ELWxxDGT repeat protein [Pseudomonadota bacterium]
MRIIPRRKIFSCHPGILCERLEERIVLDAAVAAQVQDQDNASRDTGCNGDNGDGADTVDSHGLQAAASPEVPHDLAQIFDNDVNVILVSNALDAIQGISDTADNGTAVIVFDEENDNLESICAALEDLTSSTERKIGGIAVLSHGDQGSLSIGADDLTLFTIADFEPLFAQISSLLTEDAQIQFFGCSVAADFFGQSMVNTIAVYTGADVFASTDPTGGAQGDWVLEYASDTSVVMTEIVDTEIMSNSGVELAETYPSYEDNYAVAMGGVLYFAYDDGGNGTELWRSNGTAAGTYMVADINSGSHGSDPTELTVFDGVLYFAATDGNSASDHAVELWRSDGTAAGTYMVADIYPGNKHSDPGNFFEANGVLYFTASDGNSAADHGRELWRTDGTEAGTTMVTDINPGNADSDPDDFAELGGTLYFSADDGTNGRELWRSDGAAANTVMVADINPGGADSDPGGLTGVGGTLYFAADDGTNGRELWRSDGAAANTVMVADINPGGASGDPGELTGVGGTLYFAADDGTNGRELWRSDGAAANTVMAADINPGGASGDPGELTGMGGTLYFAADDGTNGRELWRSDGTAANTVMVMDINPGADGSCPVFFNNYDGTLIFAADDGVHGYEPWQSDGTAGGTSLMVDIDPAGSSFPINFARVNPLYFMADAGSGYELWKSDGTSEGTVRVSDLSPSSGTGTGTDTAPSPPPSTVPIPPQQTGADRVQDVAGQYREFGRLLQVGPLPTGLFTTMNGLGPYGPQSSPDGSHSQDAGAGQGSSGDKQPADSHKTETGLQGGVNPYTEASGHDHQLVPEPHFVQGAIKVLVLNNGDYSITTEGFSLVLSSDMWLPPMVQWYLATVSEGRYRYGSLPPKYEAMIWDFLAYLNRQEVKAGDPASEVTLRLAWQWAEWRKQVLMEHGNREALPWDYFQGLSKALTAFYGKSPSGKVDYSSALTALKHNVKNLSIIPVRLPEETLSTVVSQ